MDKSHKALLAKTNHANLNDVPASQFMNTHPILLKANYTIKGTIETFRVHHISGAPIVDYQDRIIGVISEYDLLIQAAAKPISGPIEFKTEVTAIYPETPLKDVLIILYKQKLKWIPVMNKEKYVKGIVTRIDVLNFIATHSDI